MATIIRPVSDVAAGNWAASAGGNIAATIDEVSPDDADYVYTTVGGGTGATVQLATATDPVSSNNHVVRYRALGNNSANLAVYLLEGATVRASWNEAAVPPTFNNYTHTLSGAEADSIGNYANLRLKFEAAADDGDALLTNLMAFWELEEASGTRVDAHGANDLTDINTVTQQTGKVGSCAQFTQANNEFLEIGSNTDLNVGSGSFSWAGWVFHDSVSGGDTVQIYCQKDDYGTPIRSYLIGFNQTNHAPNNRFFFQVGNNGGAGVDLLNFSSGPSATTWYFVVAWRDVAGSPTINLQIDNGTPESLAHTVANVDDAVDFNLGSLDSTVYRMNGRIDQVGFWKRVLTTAERTWLYNSGNGQAYSELGP